MRSGGAEWGCRFINFASSFLVEFCFVILCTVRLVIACHDLLYFA